MTDLIRRIRSWQEQAERVVPTGESGIERASHYSRLSGRAFFPVGVGLQDWESAQPLPDIIVVGHHFGTREYRDWREARHQGDEDRQPTWRNLKSLLDEIDPLVINRCFMVNWFIGFVPKHVGFVLGEHTCAESCQKPCPRTTYEGDCIALLFDQIKHLKPKAVLLLGGEVVRLAHKLSPSNRILQDWRKIPEEGPFFRQVDKIQETAMGVKILGSSHRTNLVPLVHPSNQRPNQRARRENGRAWELSLIRRAIE